MDNANNVSAFMHGEHALHYGAMLKDCKAGTAKKKFISDQFEHHVSSYCDMLVYELRLIEKGGNESLPGFVCLHVELIPKVISDLALLKSRKDREYYHKILEGIFLPLIPRQFLTEQLNLTIKDGCFYVKRNCRQALEVERRGISMHRIKQTVALTFKALILFITSKHI